PAQQLIDQPGSVAPELFAIAKRKIRDKVPPHTVLRSSHRGPAERRIALPMVVQEFFAVMDIRGNRARKVCVQWPDTAGGFECVGHVIEQLIPEAVIEAALYTQLNAVVPGESNPAEDIEVAIDLLVVRPRGHAGKLPGGRRCLLRHVPDVTGRGIVDADG